RRRDANAVSESRHCRGGRRRARLGAACGTASRQARPSHRDRDQRAQCRHDALPPCRRRRAANRVDASMTTTVALPIFSAEEYAARLAVVRVRMAAAGIELLLVSAPENIFYLTGLDHWGYFAPHLLMVPAEGELVLLTRAMESVTIAHQVYNARFV